MEGTPHIGREPQVPGSRPIHRMARAIREWRSLLSLPTRIVALPVTHSVKAASDDHETHGDVCLGTSHYELGCAVVKNMMP